MASSTIVASWLLMQIVHEGGHVAGAVLTGGTVRRVVLIPWEFSRTDLVQNPHPLIVCWAGPLVGVVIPAFASWSANQLRWSGHFWLRFLSGFCLIANGTYIGIGAFTRDGDGGDLIREGSPIWTLWLFGVVTTILGFYTWHGLGKHFGIGHVATTISWRSPFGSVLTLIAVVVIELICVFR